MRVCRSSAINIPLIQRPWMLLYTHFSKTFSSSSISSSSTSHNLSKTLSLQNLLKTGLLPTLISFNQFLAFLSKSHRLNFLHHFFFQMNSNHVTVDSQTRSILIAALVKAKRLKEAEQFMTQMLKNGFFTERGIWDSLIQGFCSAGEDPEKAFSVLQNCLKFPGVSPCRFTFCLLIHSFSSFGNMSRAIEVLELMTGEKFRYPFDNFVCSSVISGFCKVGKPELALGFYDNVEKTGALVRPNVVTYTAIVNALCKEGRVKEVSDLVYKMENEGVVLDAVFYSSWICGFFENGVLEEAFRKHREMLGKGIRPDTVSYTILIDGFSKEGHVEKAVGFLNEMKKDGLQPNLVTYTAVMRGLCKKGKLEEAFNMFKMVEDLGITVDEVTYSTLIEGLCNVGDLDHVFSLLEEMEKRGISIGIITYNTVINGLCKLGRTTEADMISNSILGDNFTFTTLLRGYARENNVVGILETKKKLEEAKIRMDVVMCNVLIKALFLVGAFEDAYMIFNGMPEMGLDADSVTYCTMIDGYCRTGMISEAFEIFDACRDVSSVASVGCYNNIICGLCGNGMVDVAIDVFTELIGKSLVPEEATYMVLLRSIFSEANEEAVLEFVCGFQKSEHQIFHFIGDNTVQFLCKQGCLKTAIDLYMLMRVNGLGMTSKCYYLFLKVLISDKSNFFIPIVLNAYIKEYGISKSRVIEILVTYLCDKDVTKAIHLFDKMKEKHQCARILISAIETLCKRGRVLDAHKLVLNAPTVDSSSHVVAYTIVVDGLCKEGHLHEALDLCATMRKKGVIPNIVTYNSVMKALCQHGCFVEALRLFDSLERISLDPTHITYGTLISALSKEGYLKDAEQLFEKMLLSGLTPHTHIYNSMIDGNCKLGSLDEAMRFLTSLEKSCCEPDGFTVSSIINGFCRKGDMEGALTFYFEYKKKEILPDFFGFVYLVKGFCVKGRMEEARTILREMLQIQSITEIVNEAGNIIETESLASTLVSLCEQGNIEQAASILHEVGSGVFSSRKRYRGAANVKKHNIREVSSLFMSKSPWCMSSSSLGPSAVSKVNFGLGNSDNSPEQLLHDINAHYSLIASLCSEGNLDKANQVAKEMLHGL